MNSLPLISDIQPSRIKFEAGDRLLARISHDLTKEEYTKVVRGVRKFAGTDVRVLILNPLAMQVLKVRPGISVDKLLMPTHVKDDGERRVANLDCTKVDLLPGDSLVIFVYRLESDLQKKNIYQWIKEWAGADVEVRVEEFSHSRYS